MMKPLLTSVLADLKKRCLSIEAVGSVASKEGRCWQQGQSPSGAPVSREQYVLLLAFVAHVAAMTDQSSFRVERDLANRFCVPNLLCLPRCDYDQAMQLLTDRVEGETQIGIEIGRT